MSETVSGASGRKRMTRRRWISLVVTLLAVAAWWFTLAPRVVGGPLSAVVVNGTSMQPVFHTGDVVIVHREPSYHIGDIVAVKVDGGEVIHQLVAGNASSGWRTKGINRQTMDGWVIPNDHVLGRRWVLLPSAGSWTGWVRTPEGGGAVLAVICFFCAVIPTERRRSRHHRTLEQAMKDAKKTAVREGNDAPRWTPSVPGQSEPALLTVSSLAAFAGGLVCLTWWLPKGNVLLIARPARIEVIAVTAIVAVLGGLAAYLAARVFRGFGGSPAEKAHATLRERIVPVKAIEPAGSVVVVESARELKRIANINVAPVVHQVTPLGHRFAVLDDAVMYLFVVEDVAEPVRTIDLTDEVVDVSSTGVIDGLRGPSIRN